jgi:hypothetical protein
MKIIKPLLIFDIICFNLVIIIWGLLSVNSYRELIVNNLVVPQNQLINNLFFSSLLSCYLSSNSLLAFTYEFGKNDSNFYFHIINWLFIVISMGYNFSQYEKCDEICHNILEGRFYNFIEYYEYLPIFQIVIAIHYLCFFIKKNRMAIIVNEEFNDVFIQETLTNGILYMDLEAHSDSSEGLAL